MKKLPDYCLKALTTLKEQNFDAYAVGGCVRDSIMNITAHDIDITTSASPEDIESLFSHSVRTGGKFLTVTVIIDGNPIEITPFRKEGAYSDSRRPDNIEVASSLEEDISRRDFTINSICFDGNSVIDLLGGEKDIKEKIIRCIGDPDTRFQEDALRILRAFRFSAKLGFDIEKTTFEAALNSAHLLKKISVERILEELIKILTTDAPEIILPLLEEGALDFIGLSASKKLNSLKNTENSTANRLSAFFEFSGRNAIYSLPLSNSLKRYISDVFMILDNFPREEKPGIKHLLKNTNTEEFRSACDIRRIYGLQEAMHRELLNEIIANREPYRISHLAVNGKDLLEAGLRDTAIKECLNRMLDTVIASPEFNTKTKLLDIIK